MQNPHDMGVMLVPPGMVEGPGRTSVDAGVQVVAPSFPALLRCTSGHVGGKVAPVLEPLLHEHREHLVLILSPLALDQAGLQHLGSISSATCQPPPTASRTMCDPQVHVHAWRVRSSQERGFRTFFHLCRHCTCVRDPTRLAIAFQLHSPFSSMAARRRSSSSGALHIIK